ncbi:hypothetical protein BBF96_14860 [Anoxybacter fermentans]|uniref:ECF transporter S component n=1 Tax=Anoxybacter fermentans TaxID=1323375 RepID=A0A3S9T225_9FIRM|nr:ECF transporter S component [Anoxybacter fermentans]AZR74555.1 hypothetical protein BBF96_14860 [Anoxybacter fermentans]
MKNISAKKLVFMALFAAATTVATMLIKIPSAKGYFNLGEIMIYTAALTFGPMVGGVAGGLGAALADLFSGYMLPWAPITFVVKGIEGYLVGKLGYGRNTGGKIVAILLGGLAILIGYPAASAILYGWPAALTELYIDIIQVVVGGVVAIPLSNALRKIFAEEMKDNESW